MLFRLLNPKVSFFLCSRGFWVHGPLSGFCFPFRHAWILCILRFRLQGEKFQGFGMNYNVGLVGYSESWKWGQLYRA